MDIDKEKNDKSLFSSYFNYKQQLLKFKNLVVQEIPEGIIVFDKDIQKCLFVNNYFKDLVEDHQNILSQVSQFIFQEDLEKAKKRDNILSKDLSLNSRTLLSFLQTEKHKEINNLSTQRASFNLIYKKRNINDQTDEYQNFVFETKIIPLVWDNQTAIAIILHDITEQHTILNLKIADSEKDRIIASVSHELRTPLHCILGMIQIVMKKSKDQEILHFLSICQNSANLLVGMVDSLLDLHQIQSNKLKLDPEKIDLNQMLQEIKDVFEYQCTQKRLYLKLDISPNLSNTLFTDKKRLNQVLINLLSNALKFTNKGGITIMAKEAQKEGHVEFSVADTGIGLKAEEKNYLFKMFGKPEQGSEVKNQQGIGLGLAISNSLVFLLSENGSIKLESKYGLGSKFSFCVKKNLEKAKDQLKRTYSSYVEISDEKDCEDLDDRMKNYTTILFKSTDKSGKSTPSASRNITSNTTETYMRFPKNYHHNINKTNSTPHLRNGLLEFCDIHSSSFTVLIVDDIYMNLMIAEKLVLSHNYKVKTAFSGQAAIDLISNNDHAKEPIKLILMDCQMPEMDGFQTTLALKKLFKEKGIPEIPIVALTANDSEEDKEICKLAGMINHLSKPLRDKDLIRILDKYCKY